MLINFPGMPSRIIDDRDLIALNKLDLRPTGESHQSAQSVIIMVSVLSKINDEITVKPYPASFQVKVNGSRLEFVAACPVPTRPGRYACELTIGTMDVDPDEYRSKIPEFQLTPEELAKPSSRVYLIIPSDSE